MLLDVVGASVGIALLLYAGERIVESAVTFADRFGLPTLLIGGTLVATGSSIPEIATAIYGGFYQVGDFVAGHIIGSTTSQITVGIGVVALLSPLTLERENVRLYGFGMIAAMGLMVLAIGSGRVTRLEGLALVSAYILFLAVRVQRNDHSHEMGQIGSDVQISRPAIWVVVGFVLVAVGGHLLVVHSRALAVTLDVPVSVLGLVTGLETTAPEVVIAAVAVHRSKLPTPNGVGFHHGLPI